MALSAVLLAHCASSPRPRYRAEQLVPAADASLVVGVYAMEGARIADGDTIRLTGLEDSLRLLGIDTEEVEKGRRKIHPRRGPDGRPAKYPTEMGEVAKTFAIEFFRGVARVRLERDAADERRGRYGRHLVYVLAEKDGRWQNYNVECVRAGMSPYFTKYGFSRRFHADFIQAQAEAQRAGRGVWGDAVEHYPDYPERLRWWNARAEFIERFRLAAAGQGRFVALDGENSGRTLRSQAGQRVEILGVAELRRGRARIVGQGGYVDIEMEAGAEQIRPYSGEFVRAAGTIRVKGRRLALEVAKDSDVSGVSWKTLSARAEEG